MRDRLEDIVEHRPFPVARGPWVMFQSWRRLLFAHWRIAYEDLRPLIPSELQLEQFDGSAWIGLTPFQVADLHPRFLPAVPGLSSFPEMNLRTYVRADGDPGIYFFSLDAGSTLAVIGARLGYRLPYSRAEMAIERQAGAIHYRSRRLDKVDAQFTGTYRPTGPIFEAARGTLEYFLTERYVLFAVPGKGRVLRGDIHHRAWPLQVAELEIQTNSVPAAHGVKLPGEPDLLHYAERQDTLIWPPRFVGSD